MRAQLFQPISGNTRIYGLLGESISKSKSFDLHNRAFKALKLDGIYIPIQTTDANLKSVIEGLKAIDGVGGFNVTTPYKETILPMLDEVSPQAMQVGAINTVIKTKSGLFFGDNTDILGFALSLKENGVDPRDKEVLLLGAGGVARSTCWALAEMGCRKISIINRNQDRVHQLISDFKDRLPECLIFSITDLSGWKPKNALIINCTSVGSNDLQMVWPSGLEFPKSSVIVDLIYRETQLLRKAKKEGCFSFDGMEMLIQQAALSFSMWTDKPPPIQEMKGK